MFIELKNVTKKYGDGENAVYALRSTNLEMEEGEIVVALGPSGSGKSTLLNIIGGLDNADEGSVKIGDLQLSNMKSNQLSEYRRKDIGFIFQTYNLVSDLTAYENAELITDTANDIIPVDTLFEELGLTQYKDHFPKELSGGQQQRVAIARAMVKKPRILLCDEPTAALDSKSSKDVLTLIEKMNKKYKTTIIIITHNEIIAGMADRIIKLKDGKIVENYKNPNKISSDELEM